MDKQLTEELKAKALALGVNFCGVADLEPLAATIEERHGALYSDLPRALSIAVRLPGRILDQVAAEGPTEIYGVYYGSANSLLDHIILQLNAYLEGLGYATYPVPASLVLGDPGDHSAFSHRMAAQAAGLGWIGKSCALINPEVGPRLRLATLLTDAPLAPDAPIKNRCGNCTACVDACPAGAIFDRPVDFTEPRDLRLDFDKCDRYLKYRRDELGAWVCGCCIAACPWGRG